MFTEFDRTRFTFAGKQFVEYPKDKAGIQEEPAIVAWGEVVPEVNISTEATHTVDDTKAKEKTFGIIGAYDGHQVGVGRVAVDSTWHHFFDINLIGDPVAPFPKTEGFKSSPSGLEALSDIKAYYRNIGTWITKPSAQARIFSAAVWISLNSQPLNMLVSPKREYSSNELVHIGTLAVQYLFRYTSPCTIF